MSTKKPWSPPATDFASAWEPPAEDFQPDEPGLWSGPAGTFGDFAGLVAKGAVNAAVVAPVKAALHPVDTAVGIGKTLYRGMTEPIPLAAEMVGAMREKAATPEGAAELLGEVAGTVAGPGLAAKVVRAGGKVAGKVAPVAYGQGLEVPTFGSEASKLSQTQLGRAALDADLGIRRTTMAKRLTQLEDDAAKAGRVEDTAMLVGKDAEMAAGAARKNVAALLAETRDKLRPQVEAAFQEMNAAQAPIAKARARARWEALKKELAHPDTPEIARARRASAELAQDVGGADGAVSGAETAAQAHRDAVKRVEGIRPAQPGGLLSHIGSRSIAAAAGFGGGGIPGAIGAAVATSPTAMRTYGVASKKLAEVIASRPAEFGLTAAQASVMVNSIRERSAPEPSGLIGQAVESQTRTIPWADVHRIAAESKMTPLAVAQAFQEKGYDILPPDMAAEDIQKRSGEKPRPSLVMPPMR